MVHDFLSAMGIVLSGGFFSSLMFFVPIWGPRFAFWGLIRKSNKDAAKLWLQYTIADAAILTVFLAVVNTALNHAREWLPQGRLLPLAIASNSLVVLMWVQSLKFMEQHKIQTPRSRLLMQAIIFPGASYFIGLFATSSLIGVQFFIGGCICLFHYMWTRLIDILVWNREPAKFDAWPDEFAVVFTTMPFLAAAGIFLIRWLFVKYVVDDPAIEELEKRKVP